MLKNLISLGIKKVLKSAQSKSSHAFVNMFFAGDRILNFYWQQNLAKKYSRWNFNEAQNSRNLS